MTALKKLLSPCQVPLGEAFQQQDAGFRPRAEISASNHGA